MSKPALPAEGECRCGKVRFRITAPPLFTAACHCTGCQRMSASAFSLTAAIPTAAFEVIHGKTVVGGLHGKDSAHQFCAWCMTWMFTRLPEPFGIVNVRPTMLSDPSWFTPFVETFTSEKLTWARTPAVHSYATFPPMDQFEALVAEYAALT